MRFLIKISTKDALCVWAKLIFLTFRNLTQHFHSEKFSQRIIFNKHLKSAVSLMSYEI